MKKENRRYSEDEKKWLKGLHPKLLADFSALSGEHQGIVLSSPLRARRKALRVLDYARRGINGREKWVCGLENLECFLKDHNYFLKMIFAGQTKDAEAMADILLDFSLGEHDSVKQTDPSIYDLMSRAYEKFRLHGYEKIDAVSAAKYFQKNPSKRPLVGKYPSEKEIAQKMAWRFGVKLKDARRSLGISQRELADKIGACEKTVKSMEAGKPISSHTLLMAQKVLSAKTLQSSLKQKQEQALKKI